MTIRWTALLRHQAHMLEALAALGVTSDEAVAAYLAQLGETCDRTTLVRWRAGERQAPLGLLPVLLLHLGTDQAAELLTVLGRPLGLSVVRDTEAGGGRVEVEAAGVVEDAARLSRALADLGGRRLRTEERERVLGLVDAVGSGVRRVRALLGRGT